MNVKQIPTNSLPLVVCLLGILTQMVLAVPPPSGIAPVAPPPDGFEIEGDLLANTPTANIGDWISSTTIAPGTGGGVINPDGSALDVTRTFRFVDPYNDSSGDRIFTGGDKWVDDPNTWGWTSGKPSSKTDINNVLMHLTTDTNGHVWVILGVDRFSTSGDSYIDFELLQNPLTKNNNGTFTSAGPNAGRTTNDILLSVAFTGGGKVADFFAWRWMPSGGTYAYTDVTAMLPAGGVFVALNGSTIAAPYGAFGSTTYLANAFAEAAIDLTALLGNFDQCESFGFKTIMVKTKASSSSNAGIEDFIDPIAYNLNIGPSADAGPDQLTCSEGSSTAFVLAGKASSGVQPVSSAIWSVISGSAVIANPGSLNTTVSVSSPSATLRLTVSQANGCTKTDDVVLTVQQPPVFAIAGPGTVCLSKTNSYSGPAGMNTYAWSIAGNGSILGSPSSQTVKVVSGNSCGESFTLSLVVRSNVCTVLSETNIMVADNATPVLTLPPDIDLDCLASTDPGATGFATAIDTCSKVTVSYSDAVTNSCGVTKTITRTWLATDECGNAISGIQTIRVVDNTPPVLVRPSDRIVECSGDTSPAATGMATATDQCDSAQVSYSDTSTPACGGTQTILRKWTAVDLCGNVSTATQTITVRDTTPPVLVIPASLTLEYPAITTTNATGAATATDRCGNTTVTFADSVTNSCGNTKTMARRWTAVDECGNSTSLVQIIQVQDTIAPVITCPPSLTLEYPANTTTNATGVATATDAGGAPTIVYSDSVTNTCGNTKTIARRWTATDACGNSDSCTQMLVVRDTKAPSLLCPPNLTIECSQPTTTNFTGAATATDANGNPTVTFVDSITNSCGATMTIARRWTAIDVCGNSTNATQIITVRDTVPPMITCPPSLTLEAPAATTTNVTGVATATDVCSAATVTYSDSVVTGCGSSKVITRTWRAVDDCGNASTCVQTIAVQDTRAPSMNIPTNVVVECGGSTSPSATGSATATDAASTASITYTDTFTPLCGETKLIHRLWKATDACGNLTNATQLITVRDTTPPLLNAPANVTQQAPGDTRTSATGMATAVDGCGSATVSYSDVVTTGCGLSKTVQRTWTAVDQCGNATNKLQVITVIDTQKPVVSSPAIKVQCTDDVPAPYASLADFRAGGGTATDNSGNTNLTFVLVSDSGLIGSCPGTVTRVYRVTDDCGNYADTTQKITVHDTLAPNVTCPPSLTVNCSDSLDPAVTGTATASDNCSTDLTMNYSDSQVDSSYTLNWYASDPVPNSAPYLPTYQKFGPGGIEIPTGGRAADPLRNAVAYGPTAGQLDALTSLGGEPFCLGQIVPFQAVIEVAGGRGPENGRIEFTAAWATHTTSNDEFGYDKNYKVLCAFVDSADIGSVDPHFNAKVDSVISSIANAGSNEERILGTMRLSGLDPGDRIVVEVWVALMPTQPSHVGGTIAADIVLANKLTSPVTPISSGVKTISIGNLNKMTQLPPPQQQPPLPPQPQPPAVLPGYITSVIDRTWQATDDCGNVGTCTQRFTVVDGVPPQLTVPANMTLEYPSATGTNLCGVATAIDSCGTSQISYSDSVSNACGPTFVISRVWTARDEWGNSATATQTIAVVDTTAPTLSSVADTSIAAGEALGFNAPTAFDVSGTAAVQVVNLTTNTFGDGSYAVTCIWRATDACGNVSLAESQTISVAAPIKEPPVQQLTISMITPASGQARAGESAPIVEPGTILLRWPTNAANYRLETADRMNATRWSPVPLTPVVTNGEYRVNVPITGPSQFFRLTDAPPFLEMSVSGGKIQLKWPTAPSGYQLETSTTMLPGSWTPMGLVPASSNALNHVDLPLRTGIPQRFFRLRK